MVNNVSSVGSSMTMMRSGEMKGPPPSPKNQETFLVGDTDGDGVLSASELAALDEGTGDSTVNSINVEDAISSYDVNKGGDLSGQELLERLNSNGLSSPDMTMSKNGESAMIPPPPPSSEQALAAYGENNGNDQIAQRVELLGNSEAGDGYTPIDVAS